jgi:hypothetical protein
MFRVAGRRFAQLDDERPTPTAPSDLGDLRDRPAQPHRAPLEPIELGELTRIIVRRWHNHLLSEGVGRPTVSKAYRLLRVILNAAVDDELIVRSP